MYSCEAKRVLFYILSNSLFSNSLVQQRLWRSSYVEKEQYTDNIRLVPLQSEEYENKAEGRGKQSATLPQDLELLTAQAGPLIEAKRKMLENLNYFPVHYWSTHGLGLFRRHNIYRAAKHASGSLTSHHSSHNPLLCMLLNNLKRLVWQQVCLQIPG